MKWRIGLVALLVAIVAASVSAVYLMLPPEPQRTGQKIGSVSNFVPAQKVGPVPVISFQDATGTTMTLDRFRGKIVVLNLWATWCTPCVAEMPMLDRLQERLKDRDVIVLALSLDRGGPSVIREFYGQSGIRHLEIFNDPDMRAQSAFQTVGLPTTIIIDRQGNERGRLVGPAEWDTPQAVDIVLAAGSP
jgi:thiol-disulfide isomerase/thioredoxin